MPPRATAFLTKRPAMARLLVQGIIKMMHAAELELLSPMAADEMPRRHLLPCRCVRAADIDGIRAARVKVAAGGRVGRIGDFPL